MPEAVTDRLSRFIQSHLPLIKNMGAEISHYDNEKFSVQAPLALNHNDKKTGFGGSLYNLCILNTIGLAFIKCFEQNIAPDLIVSKAEIEYLRPVKSDPIESICFIPDQSEWDQFFSSFKSEGKASIVLNATIFAGEKEAVRFCGHFSLIGESDTTL